MISTVMAIADSFLRRLDQPDADFAAGHVAQIVQRHSQPIVDVRPTAFELPLDVLGKGLHHRIGRELAELGVVEMLDQRIDVGDRDESLRRFGK